MPVQYLLDLTQLNAKTANLHLVIHAPKKLDVAVRQVAGEIARFVEPRARLAAKGSGRKHVPSIRGIQITAGNPFSSEVKLSGYADGTGCRR